MTLKSAFKSNFPPLLLRVNRVIVLGRLPVPAECNLFPRHPQWNQSHYDNCYDSNTSNICQEYSLLLLLMPLLLDYYYYSSTQGQNRFFKIFKKLDELLASILLDFFSTWDT